MNSAMVNEATDTQSAWAMVWPSPPAPSPAGEGERRARLWGLQALFPVLRHFSAESALLQLPKRIWYDIRRPDEIRAGDGHAAQQIGIDPMRWCWLAGLEAGIDGHEPHGTQ